MVLIVIFTIHANSLFAKFGGGNGTRRSPYLVSTSEHLHNVRYLSGAFFRQTENISLTSLIEQGGWEPIGNRDSAFNGHYDGAFFEISGLTIDTLSFREQTGLFGVVADGTLKNIRLTNVSVDGHNNVGSLAGEISNKSRVIGCSASGNISGKDFIGGLVGVIREGSLVSHSYTKVNVYASGSNAGGLTGFVSGSEIVNSYATGKVLAERDKVGGLTGSLTQESRVRNCYSTAIVSGEKSVGGLIGSSSDSTVINSYWDMVTSGTPESAGGTGQLTITLLRITSDIYGEWDFDDTWNMTDYTTYPYLIFQDEPGINNYPPQGFKKTFQGKSTYWESFPVLWNRSERGCQSVEQVFETLPGTVPIIEIQTEHHFVFWDSSHWTGDHVLLNSTEGFKISLGNLEKHTLMLKGDQGVPENIPFSTEMRINPRSENWLAYFIPQDQCVFSAFGDVIDEILYIRSESWSMNRLGRDEPFFWSYIPEHFNDGKPLLRYGKMYQVVLQPDVKSGISFKWQLPAKAYDNYEIPKPEFFSPFDGSSYESLFIKEIEEDENVLEVAVYSGDRCIGAAVFQGEYPLEIITYSNGSHTNRDLSFAVIRKDSPYKPEIFNTVLVYDHIREQYVAQRMRPLRQRISFVRIVRTEEEALSIDDLEMILYKDNFLSLFNTAANDYSPNEVMIYLKETRTISLGVYDINGRAVKHLFSGTIAAGRHSFKWNGLDNEVKPVSSGVYIYKLQSNDLYLTRHIVLLRTQMP